MTGIWKIWIRAWCWAALALGLLFALGGLPATDFGARLFYDVIYWPIDGQSPFDADMRFTSAVLGSIMLGWAVLAFGVVSFADRVGSAAWRWLTLSVLVWYVADSTLSLLAGVPMNVVPNTGFLALFLVPVLASGALKENG